MRRTLTGLIIGVVLLSGCGSSAPGAPADPMGSALSYLPVQSPIVLSVQTGPSSEVGQALRSIQKRFPLLALAQTAVTSRLKRVGLDYATDIKPLLGNPLVLGSADATLSGLSRHFLVAWVTHSATKLSALVRKLHGATGDGHHDGAALYALGSGGELAVSDATALLGRTRPDVAAALDRHAHAAGLTAAQHAADVQGLDGRAALQVFGDLQALLGSPGAIRARRDPWVGALRSYGVSLTAAGAGVTFGFRLGTDPSAVTASQLPIAPGLAAPPLVSGLPIQAGIRDPAQILTFALDAVRAISPGAYQRAVRELMTAKRKTGIDIQALAGQLTGDLVIASDTHTTLARVGVGDPGLVSQALTKLAGAGRALGGAMRLERDGADTFAIPTRGRRALIAVIGRQLVVAVPARGATVTRAVLDNFASDPAVPVPGAAGSVAFRIAVGQLVALAAPTAAQSPIARQLLGLLGDLTGSISATPSALTGHATLALR